MTLMKPEREAAVAAMQALGWTSLRVRKSSWSSAKREFRRPDTGGLHDVVMVRQDQLSMRWVAQIAMRYGDAPELLDAIENVTARWLSAKFPGYVKPEDERSRR